MKNYRIPNLRRDLAVSVALLLMAVAAVVPNAIAVMVALAGIVGLMVLRLRMASAFLAASARRFAWFT